MADSGCVGLTIIWADLAEVRSLAVDGNHRAAHPASTRRLDIFEAVGYTSALMSLTYEQRFLRKLSFESSPRIRCR